MNKKNILKKAAALVLGTTLTVAATGCSFILTDNQKDMAQPVAKVDISKKLSDDAGISDILALLPSEVSKRDLIANFLSSGYQQAQTYGYEAVFTQILDALVQREIMVQYAVAHYLTEGKDEGVNGINAVNCKKYAGNALKELDERISKTDNAEVKANLQKEKALLEAHPEVLTLKYFLTDGGKDEADKTEKYDPLEDYNYTVYSLQKSFNDSLDSLEKQYIKEEDEEHNHATAQTLPTGVDAKKEKYYPVDEQGNFNYNIYTGRNLRGDCGIYESVEGSTTATRRKAYNDFLSNLQSYNLVQNKNGALENTKEATLLDYYYVELSSALGQALVNKYFEDLEDNVLANLTEDYAERKYSEKLKDQELAYGKNSDAFNTAIGSESANSITLYGLENFGFVYNILLPFSTEQTEAYERAENRGLTTDEFYNTRKSILKNVRGKDQRAGWINEHEDESYATQDETTKEWHFFKDILEGKSEFEELEHYLGVLPFNGTATLVEEKYEYTYEYVTVDDVVEDFLKTVEANTGLSYTYTTKPEDGYKLDENNTKYVDENGDVDYSKFVYRKGKINIGTVNPYDYFVKTSDVYKMVSIANEYMFAYSTDTGCLNTYMGYAVSPYTTQFVKEFEYAAQHAVQDGVGAYYVVPTEFGWHIIITTFVFGDGEVYGDYNHDDAVGDTMVEGSFSQIFYEYLKTDALTSYATDVQNRVINEYNNDDCVTLFKNRYKDLLEM